MLWLWARFIELEALVNIEIEVDDFENCPFRENAGQKLFPSNPNPQPLLTNAKMLYLIGLGLSDETDITVKGLGIVRKASRVYLEAYTSILLVEKSNLVRPFCTGGKCAS